jgi:hypothetical protein
MALPELGTLCLQTITIHTLPYPKTCVLPDKHKGLHMVTAPLYVHNSPIGWPSLREVPIFWPGIRDCRHLFNENNLSNDGFCYLCGNMNCEDCCWDCYSEASQRQDQFEAETRSDPSSTSPVTGVEGEGAGEGWLE